MGGKPLKEQPERHRWNRFSFAELIGKGILRQKSASTMYSVMQNHLATVTYLELIESELVRIHRSFETREFHSDDSHDGKYPIGKNSLEEAERASLIAPLQQAFGEEFCVWLKTPLSIGYYSVLLPRFAVTIGSDPPQVAYRQKDKDRDFEEHIGEMPQSSNVALVIEYSLDTLKFDRIDKADLYALADIPEYWVYHVQSNVLKVHRDPAELQERHLGREYRITQQYGLQESVTPLTAPNLEIAVADIAQGVKLAKKGW